MLFSKLFGKASSISISGTGLTRTLAHMGDMARLFSKTIAGLLGKIQFQYIPKYIILGGFHLPKGIIYSKRDCILEHQMVRFGKMI